jgi:hypothetical protein
MFTKAQQDNKVRFNQKLVVECLVLQLLLLVDAWLGFRTASIAVYCTTVLQFPRTDTNYRGTRFFTFVVSVYERLWADAFTW